MSLLVSLVALGGCDRGESDQNRRGLEGTSTDRPSYCPNRGGMAIRGRLFVPILPDGSVEGGDVGVRGAGGRTERPAREIEIRIYHHGDRASPVASVQTDEKGRWCAVVDPETSIGPALLAEARLEEVRLRRSVVAKYGQNISVRSEALHRLLEERVGDLSAVSAALYLNLHAVASTAVDLLDPVEWKPSESYASAVERVRARLSENDRFLERLEKLESRSGP